MPRIDQLLNVAKGYRTYAAGIAAFLVALAPMLGLLPSTTAQSLSVGLVGLAAVFHRLATRDHALTLADIQQDVTDTVAVVKQLESAIPTPPPPPAPPSAPALNLFTGHESQPAA